MASVEIWYDFGSPASYLGYWELKNVAGRTGADIDYQPMLLGGVFQAVGNTSPASIAAKGKWLFGDLSNYAAKYGLPFAMNPNFPVNTLALMRGAIVAERRDELVAYSDAMFNAVWRDRRDMADIAVVGATLSEANLDAQAYGDGMQDQAVKDALKAQVERAVAKGVFGAPTFFVGEQMWWGQDRLSWVEEALSGS
jgi:2-hydroxychromene-2-carboxylate isomerase